MEADPREWHFIEGVSEMKTAKKLPETQATTATREYVRPTMETVVTPREIRDIDQPCAFYEPKKKKTKPK